MIDHSTDLMFTALADGTRRRIVELLSGGRRYRVNDIAAEIGVTRQAVAKHLDVLGAAGMTTTIRNGRERLTSLQNNAFQPLKSWLDTYDRFWAERLGALKEIIEERDEP